MSNASLSAGGAGKRQGLGVTRRDGKSRLDYRVWIAVVLIIISLVASIVLNVFKDKSAVGDLMDTIAIDTSDEDINWDRYQVVEIELAESLKISQSGTYHLTGELGDGSVIIDAGVGDVKLILDNVVIQNSNGPAIACYSAKNLVIELVGENDLSDGASYNSDYDEDVNGAIYSKADLVFQGDGTLDLVASYQDAIVGKDDVKFNGGNYNIYAADDAVRGKDSVYIVGGNFKIDSRQDAIKSTNEEDSIKGFVLIDGGNIEIAAGDDGIHAINKLVINGGEIKVNQAYEGLEAKNIAINSGNVEVKASDDGINAGGGTDSGTANRQSEPLDADPSCTLTINGGNIYVNASGDGLDSNGYIYFNGGSTVVDGPTNNGNGALDSGAGIILNGGTVIALGSSGMAETMNGASSLPSVGVYFTSAQAKGSVVEIRDMDGNVLIAHTAAKTFSHLTVGGSDFALGQIYAIYINGEEYQDFMISSITTTVGYRNGGGNFNQMPRRSN